MYSDEDMTPAQVAVLGVLAPLWREPIKYQIPIFRYVDMPTTDEGMFELVDQLVAAVRDAEKPPVADGWYRFSCGTCGTTEVSVTSPVGRTTWQVTCLNGHPVVSGSYETSVVDPQRLYVSKPPPVVPTDAPAVTPGVPVRRPNALDYLGLLGRHVVITTRDADGAQRWSGEGVVTKVTDALDGVSLMFDYGMGVFWDVHSVVAGHTLSFEVGAQLTVTTDMASAEGDNGADGPAPMETM